MIEGVIQYRLDFSHAALGAYLPSVLLNTLNTCREGLCALGLIGQDANRYEGYGFGNISCRVELPENREAFIITGSQTGHIAVLGRQHYALVTQCEPMQNRLRAIGETPPSSEAMTHAIIYQTLPEIEAVIHVHSPDLWQNAQVLGLPITAADVTYGTPQMAAAAREILFTSYAQQAGLLAMLGHEDGIVAWGTTLAGAQARIMHLINTIQVQKDTPWFI